MGAEEEFDPVKDGTKEMEEMDANKDGKATTEEVKAFMKSRYYTKEEDLKDLEKDEDKSGDLNLEEVIAQYKDDGADMDEGADEPTDDGADEGGDEEVPVVVPLLLFSAGSAISITIV